MHYDIAVVGGGPIGSVCALAHTHKDARVALLDGNPKASTRLAGEWLHPPAVRMLQNLGIDLDGCPHSSHGKGFVVFPEDHSESILLPYPDETLGLAYEHEALVSRLHHAIEEEPKVDFYRGVKVRGVNDGQLVYVKEGQRHSLSATRIVGADGRASVVRDSLGLSSNRLVCSRMIGTIAEGVTLPYDGYGHVILGAPGPILMFQLGEQRVRIIVDVPLDHWNPQDRKNLLAEIYADYLPREVRKAFLENVRSGNLQVAGNELRPRITYGSSHCVLIGDAAGHYHPLTAVGLTLGFGDALTLAETDDFDEFTSQRMREIRAPELLAFGLYEVFADHRVEAATLRQEIYRKWRKDSKLRNRTMNLLACEDTSLARLGVTFFSIVARAVVGLLPGSVTTSTWRRTRHIVNAIRVRILYFLRGARLLRKRERTTQQRFDRTLQSWTRALLTSMKTHPDLGQRTKAGDHTATVDTSEARQRAASRLLELQNDNGSWEGEMVWCPMLTAQYVLLHHIVGQTLSPDRKRLILRQFKHTQLEGGVWGLHEHSEPYLFVTALVYVAARILGIEPEDDLLKRAGDFLREEDVLSIPSWGKFWLALLNLYEWKGLNPVLPELWMLPTGIPIHPSNWYCHTRLIYMAMAAIYSHQYQAPETQLTLSMRRELYPRGYSNVRFTAGRNQLRKGDLFSRPTVWLRIGYVVARIFDRIHGSRLRKKCVSIMVERIRWELASSSYTSISPVSGFLNILALWLEDPDDKDAHHALQEAEGWIWEDDEKGTRVTGARSVSWDTGFTLQALEHVREVTGVQESLRRGAEFLSTQQIRESFDGYEQAYRNNPQGGWCFAGIWHGWPVTDCTAEAVLGIVATHPEACEPDALKEAIQFMLRGQNPEGGFGSYESRRSNFSLEWLNPAEMFGESMTEHSYVECTASCLAAIEICRRVFPDSIDSKTLGAVTRAGRWIRKSQLNDGSWRGVWGVQYIYGTFFGIKGLLAAGAPPGDPALRLACRWLLERQREDGGWGEHHSGCLTGRYEPHRESQIVHTAWALIALIEAGDSNWTAISKGIKFLVDTQSSDGSWPREDMTGVFFRTALLDYVLYRQYFPLQALGLYERRRRSRGE